MWQKSVFEKKTPNQSKQTKHWNKVTIFSSGDNQNCISGLNGQQLKHTYYIHKIAINFVDIIGMFQLLAKKSWNAILVSPDENIAIQNEFCFRCALLLRRPLSEERFRTKRNRAKRCAYDTRYITYRISLHRHCCLKKGGRYFQIVLYRVCLIFIHIPLIFAPKGAPKGAFYDADL